jgi:hypothetical protein
MISPSLSFGPEQAVGNELQKPCARKPRRYRSPAERHNARQHRIFEECMALRFGTNWRKT